ncbi:MAG: hypothetical protein AAF750_02080 [Planctomycetota bacterium]
MRRTLSMMPRRARTFMAWAGWAGTITRSTIPFRRLGPICLPICRLRRR